MSEPILSLAGAEARRASDDAQLLLHGDPRDQEALSALAGFKLPKTLLTAAGDNGWSALHLSPDEWLLIGPEAERTDMTARFEASPVALSLVDISHRSVAIDLSGPRAADLLAGGCPLDLDAIPDGGCTRTLFGKATVLLWRRGDDWRIAQARSYDTYVVDLLRAVAEDLACA